MEQKAEGKGGRILIFVIINFLPLSVVAWRGIRLIVDVLKCVAGMLTPITNAYVIGMFPICLVAFLVILLNTKIVNSKMKFIWKCILWSLNQWISFYILLILVFQYPAAEFDSFSGKAAIVEYEATTESEELFPDKEFLGEMRKVKFYKYTKENRLLAGTDACCLTCTYDSDVYLEQKEKIEEVYEFQEGTFSLEGVSLDSEAYVGDYYFRVVNDRLDIPETDLSWSTFFDSFSFEENWRGCFVVGINDETEEIVYFSFNPEVFGKYNTLRQTIQNAGWKYMQ